jgi:hypothetical protein
VDKEAARPIWQVKQRWGKKFDVHKISFIKMEQKIKKNFFVLLFVKVIL